MKCCVFFCTQKSRDIPTFTISAINIKFFNGETQHTHLSGVDQDQDYVKFEKQSKLNKEEFYMCIALKVIPGIIHLDNVFMYKTFYNRIMTQQQ